MGRRIALPKRVLGALVAGLCAIAAAGIALIVGGDLDGTGGKALFTVLFLPGYFAAALVQGSLIGRGSALAALGWVGVAIAVAGFAAAVYLTWHQFFGGETAARVWGSLLAATIAAASLALLIRRGPPNSHPVGAATYYATLGATVALGAVWIYAIATVEGDSETLARVIGVAAVLWALGIVVLALLRLGPRGPVQ